MPFGITVAGDVFQRKLDQHFGQIEQVIVIADDIMVVGTNPITETMMWSLPTCLRQLGRAISI